MTVQCWSMVRLAGAALQICFGIKTCSLCIAGQPLAPASWGGLTSALDCFQTQGLQCWPLADLDWKLAVSVQHGQVGKFKVLQDVANLQAPANLTMLQHCTSSKSNTLNLPTCPCCTDTASFQPVAKQSCHLARLQHCKSTKVNTAPARCCKSAAPANLTVLQHCTVKQIQIGVAGQPLASELGWLDQCSWLLSIGRFAMLQPCQVTALLGNKLETCSVSAAWAGWQVESAGFA